jgi:hypothetical protein
LRKMLQAKRIISSFASNPRTEVLAIKGPWGSGKTYTWVETIKDLAAQDRLAKPKYAYVSLFGVNSLDKLRETIFEQTLDASELGKEINALQRYIDAVVMKQKDSTSQENAKSRFHTLKAKLIGLYRSFFKSFKYAKDLPYLKEVVPLLRSMSHMALKDMLICIDDYERKGDQLATIEILGLISILKEQKNCKIALIFNNDSLVGEAAKDYSKYREKVVDIEVEFKPSPAECARLVFADESASDSKAYLRAISLDITNIRVLQKIKRLIDDIWPELSPYDEGVADQVIASIVIMGWAFYCGETNVPTLEYIIKSGHDYFGLGNSKNEVSEQEKKWTELIHDYGYLSTDELDLEIAAYIRCGFYDKPTLIEKVKALNDKVIANKKESSFIDAWGLFHNSFHDNETQLVDAINKSLRAGVNHIAPINLNGTVTLLRELGRNELADELIEFYIEANKANPKIFDLDVYPFRHDISDKQIISRFSETKAQNTPPHSLSDAITKICENHSWNPTDEEVLNKATLDDYYNFFKKTESEQLASNVKACLRFGGSIGAKTNQALEKIASESKLNEIRVRRFLTSGTK